MSNYIIAKDGIYDTDALTHKAHKYLYKKKVNGKWRYFYDIGEPASETYEMKNGKWTRTDSNLKGYTKWEDMIGKDERDRSFRADAAHERARKNLNGEMTRSESDKRYSTFVNTGKDSLTAYRSYLKTPLGKIENIKNAVNNGKKAIGTLFIKIGKKLV